MSRRISWKFFFERPACLKKQSGCSWEWSHEISAPQLSDLFLITQHENPLVSFSTSPSNISSNGRFLGEKILLCATFSLTLARTYEILPNFSSHLEPIYLLRYLTRGKVREGS